MVRNKKQKHKQKRITVYAIIVLIIVVAILFGRNAMEIHSLNKEKASIQEQIAEEDKKSEQLDEDLKQIGTKSYIESMARKYLGLYYPDEKIVKIVPGKESQGITTIAPEEQNDANDTNNTNQDEGQTDADSSSNNEEDTNGGEQ